MSQCHDFSCGNATAGSEYDPAQCRKCWVALNVPAVANGLAAARRGRGPAAPRLGAPARPPVELPTLPPCAFEGAVVTRCTSCDKRRGEAKHVRRCTHPENETGKCARVRHTDTGNLWSCADCEYHTGRGYGPVTTRHLLYHVYPRRGGDWRTPVLRVRERIGLFNGNRVIAIAHDGTTDDPALVEDALAGCGCEFLRVPNNPNLREVATFEALFSRVAGDTDPGAVTLYGHAKGVTRPAGSTCGRWAETLADLCLGYWPVVEELLRTHPVVGAFKKVGRGWPAHESTSEWHYSGSWFWVRNAALFGKPDWRRIDRFWSGIEPYPSLHFTAAETGCLFHEGKVPTLNLYDAGYWARAVEPERTRFRAANAGRRTGLVAAPADARGLNLGCGPHYQPGWVNADTDPGVRADAVLTPGSPLPFADGTFARAYLGHVLEHVEWEAVGRLLAEVRRVVRPGGEVMCVGPDIVRAVSRAAADPAWAHHVWECAEAYDPAGDPPGKRHRWNCHEARVVDAMRKAGLADVRAVPVTPGDLAGWPVADFTGAQCAALGRVL